MSSYPNLLTKPHTRQSHNIPDMDGDDSHKAMAAGASSAKPNIDLTDSIHEDAKPREEPVGEKTTGGGPSVFSSEGAVGKQFTTEGMIGGMAQAIGGPLDKEGAIGKHFTESGSIGGSVQEHLGSGESNSIRK
ncbi:hypothetical protein H2201_002671 [Coniosporium apollinis]|uniref:Uncharacterized protein n=2 Tax=Coniosporium TaxID=2810619 RepID=A0ABQ9NZK1_9PEZI|nr:hypothetical protein H2199_007093 [Cladosporium sp. JES 115]KAJ9667151.1 hypothetical protein H2201_002671 [Coniosporium apollinis]